MNDYTTKQQVQTVRSSTKHPSKGTGAGPTKPPTTSRGASNEQ